MDKEQPKLIYSAPYPLIPGTNNSVGYDLKVHSEFPITIEPGRIATVNTGVRLKPSKGYYCEVYLRSSSGKRGLCLANSVGIIDQDYRGEILLLIKNTTFEVITLQPNERIAQLIFKQMIDFNPIYVTPSTFETYLKEEKENQRITGCFGSTGK